ncbi:MAG TPA: hypothetical protein VFZ12_08150 [Dehalococcoidia bacterium]|nr:hypothetical protein [Dehalococcoidia bacterium]
MGEGFGEFFLVGANDQLVAAEDERPADEVGLVAHQVYQSLVVNFASDQPELASARALPGEELVRARQLEKLIELRGR